jgi:hypothetical protein
MVSMPERLAWKRRMDAALSIIHSSKIIPSQGIFHLLQQSPVTQSKLHAGSK